MRNAVISLLILPVAAILLLNTTPIDAQNQPSPLAALKVGMDKEVLGDLKGAIEEYQRIATRATDKDKALAAQALFRMADCYQRLGNAEAQKIYERIVREFGDQKEATDARARLASSRPPASQAPSAAGIYIVSYDPVSGRISGTPTRFPASAEQNCAAAWSPDGASIAFKRRVPDQGGQRPLVWVVRSLTTGQERMFPNDGTNCWVAPVWFHDGKSLLNGSFVEGNGRIFRIDLPTMQAIEVGIPAYKPAVALSEDDQTLYLTAHDRNEKRTSIVAVDLGSGAQKKVWTSPTAVDPEIAVPLRLALSPDRRTFALVLSESSRSQLIRVGVDGAGYRVLYSAEGSGSAGAALSRSALAWSRDSRHILFMDSVSTGQQRLMRIPAEGGTPEFTGLVVGNFDAVIDLSPDGTQIAFFSSGVPNIASTDARSSAVQKFQLAWFDRAGKLLEPVGTPAIYRGLELAPDGKQIAAHLFPETGLGGDIWIGDVAPRTTMRRLTTGAVNSQDNGMPIWSPDGRRIAFRSLRNGRHGLYAVASDGSGREELLMESPLSDNRMLSPMTWSPDGRFIIYQIGETNVGNDLWTLPLTGDRKPVLFSRNSYQPRISPDGKWAAFSMNGPDGREIHVRPFPDGTGDVKVAQGGNQPRWRSDGKELYYYDANQIMAVEIRTTGSVLQPGSPRALFDPQFQVADGPGPTRAFAVSPDGQRFLISRRAETPASSR